MIPIHLRINYGGEDRFEFIRKTIIVSHSYFKTIKVLNFGADENSKQFEELLQKYSNLSVINLGRYYNACITEDLIRYNFIDVKDGEWLGIIDSDWRLPQVFLDNMQKEVAICESSGSNVLYSYQFGHTLQNIDNVSPWADRHFNLTQEKLDWFITHVTENPNEYGWPILQKFNKSTVWIDSVLGNHSVYTQMPYNRRNVPYMIHFHHRHFDDYAYCSTMIFFSWWYIGHNTFSIEDNRKTFNSWEYKAHENFKLKHNCFTSNDLRTMMKTNSTFLNELRDLFLSFEKSELFTCQQMYRLASKYDMKLWTTPIEEECNGVCCQYKEGKIFNL
jgi:hypothetical protein